VALQNQRVLIKSETGSGKTLTYLVPLIEYLSHYSLNTEKIHRDTSGTMAIIFAPTRELAMQIDVELRKMLKLFYYLVTNTLMGGESPKREKTKLRKGCVILICTPGRLLYHLKNTQSFKLDKLQYLIFDEADRILDMGFEKEMMECLDIIRKKAPARFNPLDENGPKNYWSKHLKVNLVSATTSPNIDALG
jgi:ATP-dependent RNA helicase DDX31/DBP7